MSASAADDVFDWAARDPGRAMFSREADGIWLPFTAGEFADRVAAVAVGLIAAGQAQVATVEAVWILGAGTLDRLARSGAQLPGYAVRVASDGEILVQGPGVFQGHWRDPQATRDGFDGCWFRTGDLGRIDDDGFAYITGRKKDLIITATGQNLVPAVLEDRMREHWLVSDCVITGDQRPYIGALVTLDPGAFARWKQRQGKSASATIGDLCGDRTCGWPSRTPWTARTPRCPGPKASSGSASWPPASPSEPS
jgi:hypothetical protein